MVCRSGFRSPARQTQKGLENAVILTGDPYRNRRESVTLGRGGNVGGMKRRSVHALTGLTMICQ